MKIWVDDVRPAPEGYLWLKTTNEVINYLTYQWASIGMVDEFNIEIIDLDHDAGNYANQGGDYIKILDWMEENQRNYPIHIHSMNPVGIENMKRIIHKNGWKLI